MFDSVLCLLYLPEVLIGFSLHFHVIWEHFYSDPYFAMFETIMMQHLRQLHHRLSYTRCRQLKTCLRMMSDSQVGLLCLSKVCQMYLIRIKIFGWLSDNSGLKLCDVCLSLCFCQLLCAYNLCCLLGSKQTWLQFLFLLYECYQWCVLLSAGKKIPPLNPK